MTNQTTDEAAVGQAREILASLTSIEGAKGLILSGAWDRTETMRACLAGIALGRAQLTAATRRAYLYREVFADELRMVDRYSAELADDPSKSGTVLSQRWQELSRLECADEMDALKERAEQAERMLAEAVKTMETVKGWRVNHGMSSYATMPVMEMMLVEKHLDRTLTTIRSAASGEQG